jgi:hypothetical protein
MIRSPIEKVACALLWVMGCLMLACAAAAFHKALEKYEEADDQLHKIVYPLETPG